MIRIQALYIQSSSVSDLDLTWQLFSYPLRCW